MKKLRFLITSLNSGGAESVLADLLSRLDPDVYDITLLTVEDGDIADRIPDQVHYRSILRKGSSGFRTFLKKLILKLPPKLFAALFLRGEYDCEIAYLEGVPTTFLSAKKTKGKRIVFVHCDLSVNNIIAPLYKDTQQCLRMYRAFDRVCFVSDDARKGFEKTIGTLENSLVVHNAVNVDRILALSCEKVSEKYTGAGLKLITVGRLAEEKNFLMLLSVVEKLSHDFDVELFMIGEGKCRAELQAYIREHDMDCVRLLGYKSNPYPYMKQADVFVCSSLFEGYSTTVVESVVLQLPVITTDCAGMSEILRDGAYGMIVENSAEGLYDGISNLIQNPALLDGFRTRLSDDADKALSLTDDYSKLFDELLF